VLVESIGDPAAESIIVEAKLWKADLIVMGTHGRRGYRPRELGTDASAVLRNAPIPVILVRSAGGNRGTEVMSLAPQRRFAGRQH
jgi:nucleotide-binding universal stress UspA family protein